MSGLNSPTNQNIGEGESKCDDKYVEKVFKWSELHLSAMTCSKIHTLVHFKRFKKYFAAIEIRELVNSGFRFVKNR